MRKISEEIVNRHSPLTCRRTRGAALGLIKFENRGDDQRCCHSDRQPPSSPRAVSPHLPECSGYLTGLDYWLDGKAVTAMNLIVYFSKMKAGP
ncbi:hypothetical protein EYF80_013767 [Liparis tanakae]|uniref:Uncharacterized protein n=1 Tax=Liparis tanakae TaxID=230148 RepID=A0A4Z2IEY2_9TELE|nr:hypothetical protein EYF80_013767 [Liparis tanakae]